MAGRDPRETIRRLVSLGEAVTGVRREEVESFVRDLVAFDVERVERLEELAEEAFALSRRSLERLAEKVRDEMPTGEGNGGPFAEAGEMAGRVLGVLGDLVGGRGGTTSAPGRAQSTGEGRGAGTRAGGAKKATTRKKAAPAAKKTAAKKTTAKRAAATPTRKAAGQKRAPVAKKASPVKRSPGRGTGSGSAR